MKEPRNAPVVFFGYIEKKSILRELINHEVQNKNVNRVLIQRVFFLPKCYNCMGKGNENLFVKLKQLLSFILLGTNS